MPRDENFNYTTAAITFNQELIVQRGYPFTRLVGQILQKMITGSLGEEKGNPHYQYTEYTVTEGLLYAATLWADVHYRLELQSYAANYKNHVEWRIMRGRCPRPKMFSRAAAREAQFVPIRINVKDLEVKPCRGRPRTQASATTR